MTASVYTFPSTYFAPAEKTEPMLDGMTIGSGQSVAGPIQVVKTDGGGLWGWEFRQIALNTVDKLLGWRAMVALLDGGATKMIVPILDLRQAPVPLIGGRRYYGVDLPHSDDTLFADDGTGYRDPIVTATCAGGAALRATAMTIDFSAGSALKAGMHFSVDHSVKGRRLYVVASIVTDHGDGSYDVKIRPPLRQAIADTQPLDFDRPGCLMSCANAKDLAATVQLLRFGSAPTIKFIEAF